MRNIIVSFILCLLSFIASAQTLEVSGNVQDTNAKRPLQHAVAIAVKLNDSVLVKFSRTNAEGYFKLIALPVDTYQVVISYTGFGDKTFIVAGSSKNLKFDFGKIILPPKDVDLQEVIVYAYKDPIYFKGDTLIYAADSFKVKPNATIEDLLKKLPGIRVDARGKITAQGQTVDQLLVDGDEFFGSDPTITTRNLNANTVESVQVYDKKNKNISTGGNETIKVMDLKLKEESKKGYFGKIAGGSDFIKFHEGEILLNKFKDKQKISLYSLGSNTPRASFDWQDVTKFGLNNELNSGLGEDSKFYDRNAGGIPFTNKNGLYFNDKIFKKTKLIINYNYTYNKVKTQNDINSQYFLTDSSYSTKSINRINRERELHQLNIALTQYLDSLTELEIKPKISLHNTDYQSSSYEKFFNSENLFLYSSNVINTNTSKIEVTENNTRINRRFKKKDRVLSIEHRLKYHENISEGSIQSNNSINMLESISQIKNKINTNQSQNIVILFSEPINNKINLSANYTYFFTQGNLNTKSIDIDSNGISSENPVYSNIFENRRQIHIPGTWVSYELKKYTLEAGINYRLFSEENTNITDQSTLSQSLGSFLPFANYRCKFKNNSSLNIRYSTVSKEPNINQLQPIPDNTNPNQIKKGNPFLKPMYANILVIRFLSFKPITKRNIFGELNLTSIHNAFANNIYFDNLGRTSTTPVNTNGNFDGNVRLINWFPLIKDLFSIGNNFYYSYSNTNDFINNMKNITKKSAIVVGIDFEIKKATFVLRPGGSISYINSNSSLNPQNNIPYKTHNFSLSVNIDLPKSIDFRSDIYYRKNSDRPEEYNVNYFLWNVSVSKNFLKTENLIASVEGYDLLNQNIVTNREIIANQIIDIKNNTIRRYIILRIIFKFNNNKTKE